MILFRSLSLPLCFFCCHFGFLLHFDMIMRWNGIMLFRFIFDLADSLNLLLSHSRSLAHYPILSDLKKKSQAHTRSKWLISIIFRSDFICPSKCKTHLPKNAIDCNTIFQLMCDVLCIYIFANQIARRPHINFAREFPWQTMPYD